jgi:hypothetical protein
MDFDAKDASLRHRQTPEVLPASQYLQDRLQERRARNTRPKRTRQSDSGLQMTTGQDDDLFFTEGEDGKHAFERSYDSSPLAPISRYASDNLVSSTGSGSGILGSGGRKRRMPGARELDEQMDRLTKQNFDLKLELDHRRKHQAKLLAEIDAMRATVARAERLEEEHEELMRINSLLVEELEKRDRAIQEAAEIICELEEKVEDYEETRPSTAQADSGYAGTENQDQMLLSSPQEVVNDPVTSRQVPAAAALASCKFNSAVRTEALTRPRREPAFLTSHKQSADALRSVYLDARKDLHPVKSFNSILSRHASTINESMLAEEVLNSPRLSALSESSFPSIYGKKNETPEKYDWEELPESARPYGSAHSRQDSISRVNQWIEERQIMAGTPTEANSIVSPVSTTTIMPDPHVLQRSAENSILSLSSAAASARLDLLETPASTEPASRLGSRKRRVARTPVTASMSTFEDVTLPPTPQSVATGMVRPSLSSTVDKRNFLDPAPAKSKYFTPQQSRFQADGHDLMQTPLTQNSREDANGDSDDEYHEAHSGTVYGDFGYDDYPDGNSITKGTPSRFLKHEKHRSVVSDTFFNSSDLSSPRRRRSSSEVASTPLRKPALHRADTSPSAFGFIGRRTSLSHGRPTTSYSNNSPYSYNSASSSVGTATQNRQTRSLSPEPSQSVPPSTITTAATPSRPRLHPSPASTSSSRPSFAQRTHKLLRRLSNTASNHNGEEPRATHRREREVSPLPTLTSTHSSAYQMPFLDRREIRHPSASASIRPRSDRTVSRDASASRPDISPGTMTDPNFSPKESGVSVGSIDSSTPALKRGLLRRGRSVKYADVSSVKSLKR